MSANKTLLGLIIVFVVYLALNVVCVILPYIPGSDIFILFGIVGPIIMCLLCFALLSQTPLKGSSFWIPAILFSFSYLSLGFLTLSISIAMYASV